MAAYKARLEEFKKTLGADDISLTTLRRLCFDGCPEEDGVRALCWKLLLNYLPVKRADWKESLEKQREIYRQFIDEMIIQPGTKRKDVTFEDHPLNPNPDSQWSTYFKDNDMLLQIDKDCRRLCPDLVFFQRATDHPCQALLHPDSGMETLRKRVEHTVLKSATVQKNRLGITITNSTTKRRTVSDEYAVLPDGQEAHWEVVERMLFIYAKLNPGVSYIQGMNEIIGPLYYTFSTDPNKDWQEHCEADAFFCFTNLMAEIRDFFIKTLDDSASGIGANMTFLMNLIKQKDPAVSTKMDAIGMKPQFFAFRWITLLLSQEFSLPDVLRVWDSLFSDEKRFEFLIFVCCAMLVVVRDQVLAGDFSANMKLVQNYPPIDVQKILREAVRLDPSRTQNR